MAARVHSPRKDFIVLSVSLLVLLAIMISGASANTSSDLPSLAANGEVVETGAGKQQPAFGLFGEGDNRLPCWWKICSTKQYSLENMISLVESDLNVKYWNYDKETSAFTFLLSNPGTARNVRVDVYIGNVTFINISPEYNISVVNLVAKLGAPDYVGFSSDLALESCAISLFYTSERVRATIFHCAPKKNGVSLSELNSIDLITITDEVSINRFINQQPARPWHGYGPYS